MLGGLAFLAIGVLLIYFSSDLVDIMGRNTWAEQHIGGTRQMYILIGFVAVFVGFLFLLGIGGSGGNQLEQTTNGQMSFGDQTMP